MCQLTRCIFCGIRSEPRSSWRASPAAELNAQFGAFLDSVAEFDPSSYSISPAEALLIDPQQVSPLCAWEPRPWCCTCLAQTEGVGIALRGRRPAHARAVWWTELVHSISAADSCALRAP